jgi:hypothetical protein
MRIAQEPEQGTAMSATYSQGSDLARECQGGFQKGIGQYRLMHSRTQSRSSTDGFQVALPQTLAYAGKGFAMLGRQPA